MAYEELKQELEKRLADMQARLTSIKREVTQEYSGDSAEQALITAFDAPHLPPVLQGAESDGSNDGVEPGGVAASGVDGDAHDVDVELRVSRGGFRRPRPRR